MAAVFRLHALAFLRAASVARVGGLCASASLSLLVRSTLGLLALLFENVALDVGFLVANFDVHVRARPCARLLEFAATARQRDLAWRGTPACFAGLSRAVRPAQMREQFELGLIANECLGAFT